jgi:hypothetical protein
MDENTLNRASHTAESAPVRVSQKKAIPLNGIKEGMFIAVTEGQGMHDHRHEKTVMHEVLRVAAFYDDYQKVSGVRLTVKTDGGSKLVELLDSHQFQGRYYSTLVWEVTTGALEADEVTPSDVANLKTGSHGDRVVLETINEESLLVSISGVVTKVKKTEDRFGNTGVLVTVQPDGKGAKPENVFISVPAKHIYGTQKVYRIRR